MYFFYSYSDAKNTYIEMPLFVALMMDNSHASDLMKQHSMKMEK